LHLFRLDPGRAHTQGHTSQQHTGGGLGGGDAQLHGEVGGRHGQVVGGDAQCLRRQPPAGRPAAAVGANKQRRRLN